MTISQIQNVSSAQRLCFGRSRGNNEYLVEENDVAPDGATYLFQEDRRPLTIEPGDTVVLESDHNFRLSKRENKLVDLPIANPFMRSNKTHTARLLRGLDNNDPNSAKILKAAIDAGPAS